MAASHADKEGQHQKSENKASRGLAHVDDVDNDDH